MSKPYPLQENDDYSYEFVTDQQIKYAVYFLDYSSVFLGYPQIATSIFMFNIDVLNGDPDSSISDDRIGFTILHIFNLFFQRLENVAIYVCDTSDNRQLARKRKFDRWFWKYNDGSLIKEDEMAIIEDVEIYNSMILHKNNQQLKEIILAFKELNMKAGEK